jgi:prephenate dehydratase
MAIGQCQEFLATQSQIRVTEYKDTSTSAKFVTEKTDGSLAVIGSATLAKTYQLEIIRSGISDETNNYTRFYILTKHPDTVENANKASVSFSLHDELGTLADILTVFKENRLNLSKIQSVPVPNKPTEYAFHVDLSFKEKAPLEEALKSIKAHTKRIKILGIYEGGQLTL